MDRSITWNIALLNEDFIEETEDLIHALYKAQFHLANFEEREFHLPRYLHHKYINDVPMKELVPQFNEAVQFFAKMINILFEENWKLRKDHFLELFRIIEHVFRSGHNNATVVRIMIHFLERKDQIKLGYKIKGQA